MVFRISGTLLRFTDFRREIALPGTTLAEALAQLVEAHPNLTGVLFDREGNVRGTHRLFVNGEPLEEVDSGLTLAETDSVEILTAVSGG